MDADDDMRTPTLKEIAHIADATRMKELARLGPETVDGPEIVFHPMLLVAQKPVVEAYKSGGNRRRLFDGAHDPNRVRLAFDKVLNARHDRRRRRAMATAGIRRDDQNFRCVRIHQLAPISGV